MVRVIVHGAVGYIERPYMANAETTRNCWANGHYYVTYPDIFVNGVRHAGSTAARGAACFRGFREGNPA